MVWKRSEQANITITTGLPRLDPHASCTVKAAGATMEDEYKDPQWLERYLPT